MGTQNEKNIEIKAFAKAKSVRLWQVAEKLGINDGNFSRKLRRELTASEREKITDIISQIAAEQEEK